MQTVIHRKDEAFTKADVMSKLKDELTKREKQYGGMSEVEALANEYAKTYTDNFIVMDVSDANCMISQGDIILHSASSNYYKAVKDTIMDQRPAKNMNLQEGTALTGDHVVIPMEGAELTITDARFIPMDSVLGRRPYECKLINSNKPFLIAHREHGNITMPAGEYLSYSQIDAKTKRRVMD